VLSARTPAKPALSRLSLLGAQDRQNGICRPEHRLHDLRANHQDKSHMGLRVMRAKNEQDLLAPYETEQQRHQGYGRCRWADRPHSAAPFAPLVQRISHVRRGDVLGHRYEEPDKEASFKAIPRPAISGALNTGVASRMLRSGRTARSRPLGAPHALRDAISA
jgi:hypothetical protein